MPSVKINLGDNQLYQTFPLFPDPPPPYTHTHTHTFPHRDPLAQFEVEKREHEVKMHKMEQEMEEVFEMKVQEKLQKLKDIEADVSWREGAQRRALMERRRHKGS